MTAEGVSNTDAARYSAEWWQQYLANDRDEAFWRSWTRDLIRTMKTTPAVDQRQELKNYADWVGSTLKQANADPVLLAACANEFARVAKTLGASGDDTDVIAALNDAIQLVRTVGKPTTKLYRALAACHGSERNEDSNRKSALESAIEGLKPGSSGWADVMLDLSQYYTDISQYDNALNVIAEIRDKLPADMLARRYECGASVYEGYVKISSMRDLVGAEGDLERALTYEAGASRDVDLAMWVSMAYYRKGRLAQMRHDHPEAVSNYLKAEEVRGRWPRDPRTFAFIHLRIAEALTASGKLGEAKQHLDRSDDLFRACSDKGTGRIQYCVALAAYEVANGDVDAGIETLRRTRADAREIGFHRGEALCAGQLAMLYARRGQLQSAAGAFYDLARTGLDGELGRNGTARLLRKLPTLVKAFSIKTNVRSSESPAEKS